MQWLSAEEEKKIDRLQAQEDRPESTVGWSGWMD